MKEGDKIQTSATIHRLEKFRALFFWLPLFYPKAKATPIAYQLYCFFPQKIFRINGRVPWPVHFTSRVLHRKNIEIGDRSNPGLNSGCYIQAKNGIKIGDNCRFGPNVGLISANHNEDNYDQWDKNSPIEIGDNVWIGMNSVILPGIKIGNNVIVGANSTVNSDLPDNCIAAGSPCKVIRPKAPYLGDNNKR